MQVLNSLKQGYGQFKGQSFHISESSEHMSSSSSEEKSLARPMKHSCDHGKERESGASRDEDKLMRMMDLKFSKFEGLIAQIAGSMHDLRLEVNQIKGKSGNTSKLP